jgi:predicted enzyme related to lactoylglutathione lyase
MAITVLFAGIATGDYHSALPWYERLLGRPPDLIPHENEAAWQVAGMGWIYLVADTGRAGKALLTLIVHDLDDHLAQLAERGFVAGEIETLAGVGRKAVITDPEGNMITFAEVLSTTGADSRHE